MKKNQSLKLLVTSKIVTKIVQPNNVFLLLGLVEKNLHNYQKPFMHFIKLLVQGKALISHNFHCLSVAIKMTTSLHTCVISHEHLN